MERKRIRLLVTIAFALPLLACLAWLFWGRTAAGSTLMIQARLSPGEDRPAGNAALYLLDRDMFELALVKEGEGDAARQRVFRENPGLRNLAGLMNARRQSAYPLGPDVLRFVEQSRPLWQPHVLQTARTDAAGLARLGNLKPGDYWLVAIAETGANGVAFWNLFIRVGDGQELRVMLEPGNSLQCSGCP